MKRFMLFLLVALFVFPGAAMASFKSDLADFLPDFSASGTGNLEPYEESITMTIGIPVDVSKPFPEGDSYENNVWSRANEEKLNIKLELAFTTSDSSDKVNTMIATGDIPDVLLVDKSQLKMLSDSGLIRDDLYDVYMDNAGETLRTIIEGVGGDAALRQCTFDGKLMAIPILNSSQGEAASVLWLRTDWMEKLGLQDPQNWDDLLDIIRAFVNDDPDGNGEADTIGVTFDKGLWGRFKLQGLFDVFNAHLMKDFWVEDPEDPNKVIYGAFAEETRNALEVISSMYSEGLIDPEFAVNDETAAKQRIASGKCGVVFSAVSGSNTILFASVENNPEADWKAYPVVGLDGPTTKVSGDYPFGKYMVFNKDFEHPEAMIKMVNLFHQMCFSESTTQEIYDTYMEDSSGASGFNAFTIYPWNGLLPAYKNEMAADEIVNKGLSSDEVDMFAKAFALHVEEYEAGDTSMWRWYRFFGPDGGHLVTGRYLREDLYCMNAYYGPTTDTLAENISLIYDLVDQMIVKIIMGEEDISAFDDYKAQAEGLGLNEMTAEANGWLAAYSE